MIFVIARHYDDGIDIDRPPVIQKTIALPAVPRVDEEILTCRGKHALRVADVHYEDWTGDAIVRVVRQLADVDPWDDLIADDWKVNE